MKTTDLIGPALDWAVALAQGATNLEYDTITSWWFVLEGKDRTLSKGWAASQSYNPATNWSQGGPIMDQAEIDTYLYERGSPFGWIAEITGTKFKGKGPTRLVAAMRCLVASRLGDEVEIPNELQGVT